jgi:hypothetical protein
MRILTLSGPIKHGAALLNSKACESSGSRKQLRLDAPRLIAVNRAASPTAFIHRI